MRELGELARQDDEADRARFDERWDRLAAGTLTAEEEAELAALAASSPEGGEAYEAFRPLGADFQARMVALASAELAGAPQVDPVDPPPPVLPFRRVVRRVEVWLGAATAVAASLFFLLRAPVLPPLPPYSVDPLIGNQTSRGGEPGRTSGMPVFAPGSPLSIVLHPESAKGGQEPLEAQAFLVPAKGGTARWASLPDFRRETAAGGDMHLRGKLDETLRGIWRICVVLSRPGKAPTARELPVALKTEHAGWQVACTEPFNTVSFGSRPPAMTAESGAKVDP